MKTVLALISDIHGNMAALEAALRYVDKTGVDGYVFMGDYVSDFPDGHAVVEMIREIARKNPAWFIKGNREDYMLDHRMGKSPEWGPGSAFGSLKFAYDGLTEDDLDFFRGLDYQTTVKAGTAKPFTACHASPRACRENIIWKDEAISQCLDMIGTDVMVCGHSHHVRDFQTGKKRAHFIGSVGLPENAGGCCQFAYAAYDGDRWDISNVSIAYDVECAVKRCEASGLMEMGGVWTQAVIHMARTGQNIPNALIGRAMEIARREGFSRPLPEEIWQRAGREIGII